MSLESKNGQGEEHGVTHLQVPTMRIMVDPQTMNVTFNADPYPLYFWQMVIAEVTRQLDFQRRAAEAGRMREAIAEQERVAALMRDLQNKR